MNQNNGKTRLVMKMRLALSHILKNYMPENCRNVQKLDYQGAESKSFFEIFKLGWTLVFIDANTGFQIVT